MSSEHTDELLPPDNARMDVIRDIAVFQVKLVTDGFKDLLLSPLSLLAGIVGVLLGGKNPGAQFYRLLRFGQRAENWIGLFSAAYPKHNSQQGPNPESTPTGHDAPGIEQHEHTAGDFDALVDRLQSSLLDPATRSRLSEQSKKHLETIAKRLRRDGA